MTRPGWDWTAEEIRAAGHRVADVVADHLTGLPDEPVFRPVPAAESARRRAEPAPRTGVPFDAVLDEVVARVLPHPFGNGHPRFFGWVNSPPGVAGVLAEALAAAVNPSVAGGNSAAVHLEHQVVRWFAELAGFPPDAGGLLVSGGSAATLTAFAVARHRAAARVGIDVRADGLQGSDHRFTAYVGAEGHGCAHKAIDLLGIGSANLRTIGSDADRRMRPDLLREALAGDVAAGRVPVVVMATVGTVNTGAIDDVGALAAVCREFDVWLHVDGAYGGPAVLLHERYAATRAALAGVDSIALDPHKWLYVPVDAGLLLLREPGLARDAFSLVPAYLRTDGDEHGVAGPPWFSEFGLEQTRPFRALKVWTMLRHVGLDGYRDLIDGDLRAAAHLADAVRADPGLELLAHGMSIVVFRCAEGAPGVDGGRDPDALDRAVLRDVQLGGRAFLSGTTLDGAFALRACVVNPGTTTADVDALLAAVRDAATRGGRPRSPRVGP